MIPLTRAIPERIRDGYDDTLYKSTFAYFTLLYLLYIYICCFPEILCFYKVQVLYLPVNILLKFICKPCYR